MEALKPGQTKNDIMTEHNHVKKLQAKITAGELSVKRGTVQSIGVLHDDDCAIFDGGYCDCDPDIKVRWTQTAASKN